MKPLLRTCALTATLALSAFAMTGHASITNPNGTCRVICSNPTTHMLTSVSVFTTESQCCSESFNPCPAGYNPTSRSFTPQGGFARLCSIN